MKNSLLLAVFITNVLITECNDFPQSSLSTGLSEDGRSTFTQIAAKYGHPAKEYDIVTEDGYILKLFQLPGNASRPVLLVHGNIVTADSWIIRGNISLAITLADQGYDVWAMNVRGTRYSPGHVTLNMDTQADQFYNFSFYEMGIYDLPSTIDFVLQTTGQKQLITIGHSLGTTLIYVIGSEKPEYNDKIKLSIALSPICFMDNLKGLAAIALALGKLVIEITQLLNIHGISYQQFAPIAHALCLQPLGYEICVNGILSMIAGPSRRGIERNFLSTFIGHMPGGTSIKIYRHLFQIFQRKEFTKFDYGRNNNLLTYGTPYPPELNLSKVTMKSALFTGKTDFLGTVRDAKKLRYSLPNVVHYQVLPYEQFNHADFIWGRYMPKNLYPHLLPLIKYYSDL